MFPMAPEFYAAWWRSVNNFSIELHGVKVRLHASHPQGEGPLAGLARDFAAFSTASDGVPEIDIEFCAKTPWQLQKKNELWTVCRRLHVKVLGFFNRRVCIYAGDVVAETRSRGPRRRFWIAGENLNLVRQTAYKMLLSALGEALDAKGIHRVHAFGFERFGHRGLLIAPSGLGKSALASVTCLNERGYKLFSDESPLLAKTRIFPFPTRLSLEPRVAEALGLDPGELLVQNRYRDKVLLPFPIARIAESGFADSVLIGVPSKEPEPHISPVSVWRILPILFLNLVIGLGLAQMAEWMLRVHGVPRLIRIALMRTRTLFHFCLHGGQFYVFHLSRNANQNSEYLERFLIAQTETVSWLGPISKHNYP